MTQVQTIAVEADEAEMRLDRWFRRRFPHVTNGQLQKLLRTGQVRLDGKRAEAAQRVAEGQSVRVPPLAEADAPLKVRHEVPPREAERLRRLVLYKDEAVIAIDKPAGLAVQGGTGTTTHLDGMLDALAFDGERPRLVHRLDRETSGVLLLARTAPAARALTAAFRTRDVRKTYWALTIGVPSPDRGRIDAPLAKLTGPSGERMAEDHEAGQRATTLYSMVDEAPPACAWVALWPLTGRTHQLRVHMAAIGTPILGDHKYADGKVLDGAPNPDRLHLHARRLVLPHPSGGKRKIDVTAPLSPHMAESFRFFGFEQGQAGDPFAEIEA